MVFNNIIDVLKRKMGTNYSNTTNSSYSTETKFYDNILSSTPPDISEYIEKRFKPQLNWYEKKASANMLRFRILRISIIILSFITSTINATGLLSNNYTPGIQLFTAIVTALILTLTSLLQLTKSQEDWILFRATAERLKSEYHSFVFGASPYYFEGEEDKDIITKKKNKLFVERIENIYLTEGSEFATRHKQSVNEKSE
jgi:hypothetical protein